LRNPLSEALHRLGIPVTKIDRFLITHSHADHIGGLEEVMLMDRFLAHKKPAIIITEEYQELLWGSSLRGGATFNERIDGRYLEFEDYWTVERPTPMPGARDAGRFLRPHRNQDVRNALSGQRGLGGFGPLPGPGLDDRVLSAPDTRVDPELVVAWMPNTISRHLHDCQALQGRVHASLRNWAPFRPTSKPHLPGAFGDAVDDSVDGRRAGLRRLRRALTEYRFD
jgi:hypothetical protein